MKNFNIKVERSSDYWSSYEGEISVYYSIRWKGKEKMNKFFSNEKRFIDEYVLHTYKYGFALPLNYDSRNLMKNFYNFKVNEEKRGVRNLNVFSYMYNFKDSFHSLYPSVLFVNMNDIEPKLLINIDPYRDFSEFKDFNLNQYENYSSPPFRIEFMKNDNELAIISFIDNDIFNESIDNTKTKRESEIGGKGCWVDNSDLAYLNSTRLNSFLRDIKMICFEFFATDFEFENSGLNYFTQNGVLLGNEVVYYEDIYDLMPDEYKYKATSFEPPCWV